DPRVPSLPRPISRHPPLTPQSLKLTYPETLDRIKEEFQFLQNQYHSLKLECEKLATEKTEIQRHYVMVSELHLKGGWWGMSSPLSHQTQPWDSLASPCVWVVWPGPEIWFLWLLLSLFPPE
uniref:Groucho/TLE N-terminal Q-rich domain-containing protein n=1 Tax=Strix occidentalis caurina TaxID=311401 RepID=A0A8D0EIH0_STROC